MANDKSQVKYFRMNSTNLEAASESAEIKYESMQHHQIDESIFNRDRDYSQIMHLSMSLIKALLKSEIDLLN